MAVKEWELQAHISTQLKRLGILHHGDQNSGKRGPQAQAMMKATGACKGWPDMVILPCRDVVIWIEFKTAKGKLSPEQIDLHTRMAELGQSVFVVQAADKHEAWDKVRRILDYYG